MSNTLLTESGDLIICEDVAGVTGASSLNDSVTATISKETFDTNPTLRGWLIGSSWAWSSINTNMEPI